MKTNKPKKYPYNCQLIDAWLTNQLPPEGGYYKGSSTHLECDATHFWAGEDQAFLLALKHPDFALLLSPVADIPFTGAVCDASRMVAASYTQTRDIRFLVPLERREKSHQLYNIEKRNPCGIPTLFVPHLCEGMVSASIESLLPAVYKYYDRAFKKHFAAKGRGAGHHLLGYYDWNWNDKDKHTKAVARVKQTFNALSLPFKPEWDQMAFLRTAKMRLAA
jgi:hypothetical protein